MHLFGDCYISVSLREIYIQAYGKDIVLIFNNNCLTRKGASKTVMFHYQYLG